jgi:hypothetical protein
MVLPQQILEPPMILCVINRRQLLQVRYRTPTLPIADMRHVVAAERTTGISPGAAAQHGIERLAGLAELDAGAARATMPVSRGLAAERRA